MKIRDVIIAGNAAWEIVSIGDNGRQVAVKLIAGSGTEARMNDVPFELLSGQPIYRRVETVDDIDAYRAAEEVGRYVDVPGCGWDPRRWLSEFRRKHPAKSAMPDDTTMFGWIHCILQAGEAKGFANKRRKERPLFTLPVAKRPRKSRVKPEIVAKAKPTRKPAPAPRTRRGPRE